MLVLNHTFPANPTLAYRSNATSRVTNDATQCDALCGLQLALERGGHEDARIKVVVAVVDQDALHKRPGVDIRSARHNQLRALGGYRSHKNGV